MNFHEQMGLYAEQVNRALLSYLPKPDGLQKSVVEAMRYSAMAGGKRVRPILTLEFCRICGKNPDIAMPYACAIEMVHTYSLIHDDLPCMDDDDMRRGRLSCHKKFGEATALLAGDALLSLAFETALCHNDSDAVKSKDALRAAGILARASGASGMVGGQIIDLESEGRKVSFETLEFMHRKKTGAMIKAAAQIGCVAAGADEEKIKAAGEYAERIGLVFQIVDDILDISGSSDIMGKPAGSDLENNKNTYITHLGIEKSRMLVKSLTAEAIRSLKAFEDTAFLSQFAEYLSARDR